MPISEAEAFGPTLSAKRKKSEETGFIESALAGVATGLINIQILIHSTMRPKHEPLVRLQLH